MNTDRLNSTNAHHVAVTAFSLLNAVQDKPKQMQINSVAVLFKVFSEELKGQDVNSLLTRADMILADADMFYHAEVRALRDYINEEINK
jgi:hypothetical protein